MALLAPPGPPGKDGSLAEIKGISDVPGLETALGEKADKGHTHDFRDVVGLQAALTEKMDFERFRRERENFATRSDLQQLQSQVNSAPKIQVVSSLPYSPDRSTIYVVTG